MLYKLLNYFVFSFILYFGCSQCHDPFLCLDNEESFTIRGVNILCLSLFDETIAHISTIIINQNYEKSELVPKAKIVVNLVRILHNV